MTDYGREALLYTMYIAAMGNPAFDPSDAGQWFVFYILAIPIISLLIFNPVSAIMVMIIPILVMATSLQPSILNEMNTKLCAVSPYYNRKNEWGLAALSEDKSWGGVLE